MQINIINKHIFWLVENVWTDMDYRIKNRINIQVTLNPEDDYVQSIEFDELALTQIMASTTMQPYGVAKLINPDMAAAIIPQIEAAAADGDEEAQNVLVKIEQGYVSCQTTLDAKILNGKTQILS